MLTIWGLRKPLTTVDFIENMNSVFVNTWCNMDKCFDVTRCRRRPYRHYVYPIRMKFLNCPWTLRMSDRYRSILEILGQNNRYFLDM